MHDMNDDIEIETGTAGTGMKETIETAETGNAGVFMVFKATIRITFLSSARNG